MTSRELFAAVARATGEEIEVIAERGFNLVDDRPPLNDDDWAEMALDWDAFEAERRGDDRCLAA